MLGIEYNSHTSLADVLQSAALGGPPWPVPADLDKPCFQRATGELMTGRQRLELLARHWAEHVRELQEAAKAR